MIKSSVKYFFSSCLLLFYTNSQAQIEYSISGYVQDFPIITFTPSKLAEDFNIKNRQLLNLTRFRLRPVLYLGENSRINIEYEIAALYFNSESTLLTTSSGKTNRQLIRMNWMPGNEKHFRISHLVDRLYFKHSFDDGNIIFGRQRISWGTGRIWNPTDLFNPINPANFFKIEKDGADAISFKYFLGNFTDLNVVVNPKEILKESNFGARFRTNVGEYDFALIGGKFDDRIVAGADFAGNLLYTGVRGEAIISFDKDNFKNNFTKFILGIDAQFTSEWYAVLEYHFNGQGVSDTADYDFEKLISGEILNFNRNYFYTGLTYQYSPLLTFNFGNLININDRSGYFSVVGNYSITEDFFLNAGGQISYGSNFSEYWYYGSSIYLQAEYYF